MLWRASYGIAHSGETMRIVATVFGIAIAIGAFAACFRAWAYTSANRYLEVGAYQLVAISVRDELNLMVGMLAKAAVVAAAMLIFQRVLRRLLSIRIGDRNSLAPNLRAGIYAYCIEVAAASVGMRSIAETGSDIRCASIPAPANMSGT